MENNSEKGKIIKIDIEKSTDANFFNDTKIIHKREFDKIKSLIEAQIEKVRETEKEDDSAPKIRSNHAITILGSRGSGKTSFMMSVRNWISKEKKGKVLLLDTIDPTLIEEKGHIFLTIVSLIKNCVDDKFSKEECCDCKLNNSKKKDWENILEKFANGLPVIDGLQTPVSESWQDSSYIMEKGLKSVKASKDLESNFNEFLRKSLAILHKDAFIIMLDDIDIDFKKGWPVLETIRKYLTSPLIITLISGDMKLFSKAVRKQQWSNFGKALLKNELDFDKDRKLRKSKEFGDIVTEMESQYLQKVLKSQNRIFLRTLHEIIQRGDPISVCLTGDSDPIDVKQVYNGILNLYGIHKTSLHQDFLLELPLRTQVQFLSAFQGTTEGFEKKTLENVFSAFLSDLYEKEIDIDLVEANPSFLCTIILKLLLGEDKLYELHELQPISTDKSLNAALFSLGLLFSEQAKKHPEIIFDYMIKICYIRNLNSILALEKGELCNHCNIYENKNTASIAGYIASFLRSDSYSLLVRNERFPSRFPRYYRKRLEKNIYGLLNIMKNQNFDGVFKKEFSFKKDLAFLPLSLSVSNKIQRSYNEYSFFSLLGAIAEIIKSTKDCENEAGINAIKSSISFLGQCKKYPFKGANDEDIYEEDDDKEEKAKVIEDDDRPNDESTGDDFAQFIADWIKAQPKKAVSPHLISKIISRSFYAFDKVPIGDDIETLGEAMNLFVCIFLNAIIAESFAEAGDEIGLNRNNIRTKDSIFYTNVQKLKNNQKDFKKFEFCKWILNCPLLLIYLQTPKELLTDEAEKFSLNIIEKYSLNIIEKYSLFEDLKKIELSTTKNNLLKFGCGSTEQGEKTLKGIKEVMTIEDFKKNDFKDSKKALKQKFIESSFDSGKIKTFKKHITKGGEYTSANLSKDAAK